MCILVFPEGYTTSQVVFLGQLQIITRWKLVHSVKSSIWLVCCLQCVFWSVKKLTWTEYNVWTSGRQQKQPFSLNQLLSREKKLHFLVKQSLDICVHRNNISYSIISQAVLCWRSDVLSLFTWSICYVIQTPTQMVILFKANPKKRDYKTKWVWANK